MYSLKPREDLVGYSSYVAGVNSDGLRVFETCKSLVHNYIIQPGLSS